VTGANDPLHLLRRSRQDDDRRHLSQMRQRIAFVRHQLHRLVQDVRRAANGGQFGEQGMVHA
jgi:hypothetical protein